MSDLKEDCIALTEARKERHANWKRLNLEILNASGLEFIDKGEALLFRTSVKADFYPSTGRWRSNNKTFRGGAKAFISWIKKQERL